MRAAAENGTQVPWSDLLVEVRIRERLTGRGAYQGACRQVAVGLLKDTFACMSTKVLPPPSNFNSMRTLSIPLPFLSLLSLRIVALHPLLATPLSSPTLPPHAAIVATHDLTLPPRAAIVARRHGTRA